MCLKSIVSHIIIFINRSTKVFSYCNSWCPIITKVNWNLQSKHKSQLHTKMVTEGKITSAAVQPKPCKQRKIIQQHGTSTTLNKIGLMADLSGETHVLSLSGYISFPWYWSNKMPAIETVIFSGFFKISHHFFPHLLNIHCKCHIPLYGKRLHHS